MREAGGTIVPHDTCDTSTAVVEGLTRSMLLSVQKILLRHSDLHSPTNEGLFASKLHCASLKHIPCYSDSDFAHCKHLLAVLSDDLTSMMSDQVPTIIYNYVLFCATQSFNHLFQVLDELANLFSGLLCTSAEVKSFITVLIFSIE